jgi:pullulanase
MIRWDQKLENRDMVDYYQGLIRMRKNHPIFHLGSAEEIRRALSFQDDIPAKTIGYTLTDPTGKDRWGRAHVFFNAASVAQQIAVPAGAWKLYVDGVESGDEPLLNSAVQWENGRLKVPPRCAVVLGEARE